jgi:3-phenylpropionate/cinnamic acid dioxygenase small subunit
VTDLTLDTQTRLHVVETLVRYATGIDRRDWSAFRSCFTDDCDVDYGDIGAWHNADDITAYMVEVHAPCGHTMHRVTNHALTPAENGVAARSYVDAIIMGGDNRSGVRAIGYYDDELVATDDGWKIARRRFTLVYAESIGGR